MKKETILLDARLHAVIDKHAFEAKLANGHRLVAFFAVESILRMKSGVVL